IMSMWPNPSQDHAAKKTSNALYQAIKSAICSEHEQGWHSHSLADDDEDVQYLTEDLPTQEPKQTFTSQEDFRSKMQGHDTIPKAKAEKIFQTAWRHREV